MSKTIRIDEELYDEAKQSAMAEFRTPPLQIVYWAKIGKIASENPNLPIEFIRDTIIAKMQKSEPFEFVE